MRLGLWSGSMTNRYQDPIGNIFNSPGMKMLRQTQEILKGLSLPVVTPQIVFTSELGKIIEEWQSRQSVFSNEIQKVLAPLQGLDSAIGKLTRNSVIQNHFEHLQKVNIFNNNIFENIDFYDLLKNLEVIELDDENLTENEKEQINQSLEALSKIFPDIGITIESIKNKNYLPALFMIILFIYNMTPNIKFYSDLFLSKTTYTVNRENVRIRTTPTTKTKDNIIKKLHKNEYVEEIENKNGWVKVTYPLEDGKEIEGWVYRTMLTKID